MNTKFVYNVITKRHQRSNRFIKNVSKFCLTFINTIVIKEINSKQKKNIFNRDIYSRTIHARHIHKHLVKLVLLPTAGWTGVKEAYDLAAASVSVNILRTMLINGKNNYYRKWTGLHARVNFVCLIQIGANGKNKRL